MISFLTQMVADKDALKRHDAEETAAWHGRGGIPAPIAAPVLPVESAKPAISGLYAVQGDGRYVHTVG